VCACWQQITILESLVYSARLRFGNEVERHVVYAFVQEVRTDAQCAARCGCLLASLSHQSAQSNASAQGPE
jgi:hypothetical protein